MGTLLLVGEESRTEVSGETVQAAARSRPSWKGAPERIGYVQFMVHEAVINAARHGGAKAVEVRVEAGPDRVRLLVADNGRGLPFHGRREHAALRVPGSGPVTLWSRIDQLGGTLTIDSSTQGVRLEIVLPLERPGARRAA